MFFGKKNGSTKAKNFSGGVNYQTHMQPLPQDLTLEVGRCNGQCKVELEIFLVNTNATITRCTVSLLQKHSQHLFDTPISCLSLFVQGKEKHA